MKLPDFPAATASYEHWLEQHLTLLPHDLELKHQQMAAGAFPFFRATFYRWMQLWFAGTAAAATKAPAVLAVGDLHVENFGTWRDSEGRLVWGVNDFDEAYRLPYTLDLVRLAASAHLAIDGAHLSLPHDEACDAILAGYSEGIAAQGMPFVLAEKNSWLRALVSGELREPEHFWSKLDACVTLAQLPPASAVKAVTRLLPDPKMRCRWVHRVAGVGSLGRQRFVALGVYAGSQVAREAKALAPSACVWAANARARRSEPTIYYQEMLESGIRALDPYVHAKGRWIVRRLAPDCSRVELASLPHERDESRLLHAMGFETANVHLSHPKLAKVLAHDLGRRPKHWLHQAAAAMLKATLADLTAWSQHQRH